MYTGVAMFSAMRFVKRSFTLASLLASAPPTSSSRPFLLEYFWVTCRGLLSRWMRGGLTVRYLRREGVRRWNAGRESERERVGRLTSLFEERPLRHRERERESLSLTELRTVKGYERLSCSLPRLSRRPDCESRASFFFLRWGGVGVDYNQCPIFISKLRMGSNRTST